MCARYYSELTSRCSLERGERIELLVDQTDRLSQAAFRFEQSSVRLRQQMWWKRARNQIILAACLVFIVFISISVGWCVSSCCRRPRGRALF